MNETLMTSLLESLSVEMRLLPELAAIVEEGFVERDNGLVFLKSCLPFTTHANVEQFQDLTGFECFVNSIHVDEVATEGLLLQALLFASALRRRWIHQFEQRKCVAILSLSPSSTVVKLHTKRTGEHWLDPEVDSYHEAVFLWE
jgi:hypothetical protein